MKRRTPLRRKVPIKPRRSTPRRGPARDPAYMRWIRTQYCAAATLSSTTPCDGRIHAHHAGARGLGQKAADATCIPLCREHHSAWHDLRVPFLRMKAEKRRTWAAFAIQQHQNAYEDSPF